ncbi:MAG: hypothetical protein EKK47_08795 [Burkholderiales bacterium]|nr:MAG: hypothetical protein EKK47_08795 [Burkholderiales bacterium]
MTKKANERDSKAWHSYAGRLLWAMRRAGKTNQSELARTVGVKPQSIQYLCDPQAGAQGSSHTPSLARVLGVQADWLATGQGKPLADVMLMAQDTAAPGYAAAAEQAMPVCATLRVASKPGEVEWLAANDETKLGQLTVPVVIDGAQAVRVKGDGLSPFVKDGQCLLLRKRQDLLEAQDTVLITLKDGRRLIRELMVDRQDSLLVLPVHGGQPETIDRQDVEDIDLVLLVLPRRWWRG